MTAQFLAQGADGIAQAAFADILVLEPTSQGTPGRILALFAITLIPYSIIAPFLGVFVDRWDRRKLLAWTNAIRAVLLLTIFLWSRALPGDGALFVAVLVLQGLGRLFLATKGAVLPVVLHEHHLIKGNAFSGAGGTLSAVTGGGIGLAIVGFLGANGTLTIAGLLYVIP
ncbi:MAG: MFS transporter, partial [Actinobacteria bacterium]|nr:MFS transporter [Actinomycetota bacterium]